MSRFLLLVALFAAFHARSQTASLRGALQDPDGGAVEYANVLLYNASDSALIKVEITDEQGHFRFRNLSPGVYRLQSRYVGLVELRIDDIAIAQSDDRDLGSLRFRGAALELREALISASRPLVEVRPDRTVFNVQGTINSAGSDALSLLRKAPGTLVDNNDNISVLGRSGVLLYVDGKRLPLSGQALSDYLQNLPAEQIDRIEIISNPGARYEAEGNAGIIDIRLKKDKNLGANGTVNTSLSQGVYHRANLNGSANYRNRRVNVFGSGGAASNHGFNNMEFLSYQNGLQLDEINRTIHRTEAYNLRAGADFFLNPKHTIGLLASANQNAGDRNNFNRIALSQIPTPTSIDSILRANTDTDFAQRQATINLNYRYEIGKGRSFNLDLDYGRFENDSRRRQPNLYFDPTETALLTSIINSFDTPTDIDIYTAKADYEESLWGGSFETGAKFSRVLSDNTFLFFDEKNGQAALNLRNSNSFRYDERVYAAYVNYARPISARLRFSGGIRAEKTDASGDLQAFLPELQEPPVLLNYLSWFPSAGLTWQLSPANNLSLNYGRRINRPDYNVLNPFNNQLSQLSYEKGNPFLAPEIVNNIELGYTLQYRYNFKIAYSRTTDQITRLIAPDTEDPRAGFITWANLAEQKVYSFNINAPVQIAKKWNAYFNLNASYIDNQADYGNGAVVDVQAFNYVIYQQHTFDLPAGFKGEVSGYYSGPGVWGGVFKYESNWSLDLGLQRRFLRERLNARISVNDIFYETGWDGVSVFNGLESYGSGRWDSRRVSLSLGYRFGNDNVKSRRRASGIESEAGRVKG